MQTHSVLDLDNLEGPEFDLDAGDISLAFTNTVGDHASPRPEEYLNNYGNFLRWAYVGRVAAAGSIQSLLEYALAHPQAAEQSLAEVRALREALFRIFSARVHAQPVDKNDLDLFNHSLSEALAHARVVFHGDVAEWVWEGAENCLDGPLWPIARAAADLLTSENMQRVGQCQDDRGCGWLFIDTSKNHTRRWCSMESCGNRAKAHRHYGRKRQADA
jgi:predicted RNA-binding Zn ribbon-like protein